MLFLLGSVLKAGGFRRGGTKRKSSRSKRWSKSAQTLFASWAQSGQRQPTDAQLSRSFRDSFLKGCKSGKTPTVSNQSAYCTCMANGYQARYDGKTLTAISQVAGSLGQKGPALVNLMMQPEGKRCVAGS